LSKKQPGADVVKRLTERIRYRLWEMVDEHDPDDVFGLEIRHRYAGALAALGTIDREVNEAERVKRKRDRAAVPAELADEAKIRRGYVYMMYASGKSFREIGASMGISAGRAGQLDREIDRKIDRLWRRWASKRGLFPFRGWSPDAY
jgi:hypothetical protein